MSSPARDRLFRGYGPLIGFAAVFLAVALLVPSQQREVRIESDASDEALEFSDEAIAGTTDTVVDPNAVVDPAAEAAARAAAEEASRRRNGQTGGNGPKTGANAGPAKVAGCGAAQVPGDPYSPPCVQFSGGNGGATSRGVTATDIVVSARVGGLTNGLLDALSKQAGQGKVPNESPEVIRNTLTGLVEFFNKRFQFYGRQIKLQMFDGKGNPLQEILGGGQEGAQADSIAVAQEMKAFAEAAAISLPYADALAAKGVINIGVPYASREWMSQRKPHVWSAFIDCSSAVESVTSYYATKLAGKNADFAGGDLKGRPRTTALLAPENSWYQECVQSGLRTLEKAGKAGDLKLNEKYKLDTNTMNAQARTLVTKFKAANVTTVVCGCDPLILTFLTSAAQQQGYSPEWVITGVAFVDNDLIGQIQDQTQWSHSFGVSYSGPTQPARASLGYRAYKSVRKDEPSVGVDLIYNQLYMLAIGIQGAGPNLTPQSFEKGMFDYPNRTGPYGTWGFGPNDYTTSDDAREIYYDPRARSQYNGEPGVYVNPNGAARFPIGQWNANPPRAAG